MQLKKKDTEIAKLEQDRSDLQVQKDQQAREMFGYKAQAEQQKVELDKALQQNSWDQSEIKDLKAKVELLQAELQS